MSPTTTCSGADRDDLSVSAASLGPFVTWNVELLMTAPGPITRPELSPTAKPHGELVVVATLAAWPESRSATVDPWIWPEVSRSLGMRVAHHPSGAIAKTAANPAIARDTTSSSPPGRAQIHHVAAKVPADSTRATHHRTNCRTSTPNQSHTPSSATPYSSRLLRRGANTLRHTLRRTDAYSTSVMSLGRPLLYFAAVHHENDRTYIRKNTLTLWSYGDSNPRPLACHASALPTEL